MFKRKQKEKIRRMHMGYPLEVKSKESYFEKMSEEGYLLSGNSALFLEFTKCEPKKRKFHIEYFYKASIFDSKPEKNTEEFIDYCESAGWTHCLSVGKMQCFYTEDLDNTAIETDSVQRFKNLVAGDFKTRLPMWLLCLFYLFMQLIEIKRNTSSLFAFTHYTTTTFSIMMSVFWWSFILFYLIEFVEFMTFYLKNKRRIKNGQEPHLITVEEGCKKSKRRTIFLGALFVILLSSIFQGTFMIFSLFISFLAIGGLLIIQSKFYKSKSSNRKTNIIFTIVAPIVVTPLMLGGTLFILLSGGFGEYDSDFDFRNTYSKVSIETAVDYKITEDLVYQHVNKSFLASEVETSIYPSNEKNEYGYHMADSDLEIVSYFSKNQVLLDKYLELLLDRRSEYGLEKQYYDWTNHDVYTYKIASKTCYIVISEDRIDQLEVFGDVTMDNVIELINSN